MKEDKYRMLIDEHSKYIILSVKDKIVQISKDNDFTNNDLINFHVNLLVNMCATFTLSLATSFGEDKKNKMDLLKEIRSNLVDQYKRTLKDNLNNNDYFKEEFK